MGGLWAVSYIVLWLLVVVLAIVVVALARQIGTLHLRLGPRGALEMDDEGPALGEAAVAIDANDVEGNEVVVGGPGRAQLMMFVTPGCRVCDQVVPSLSVISRDHEFEPIVISDHERSETARSYPPARLKATVVADANIVRDYAVPGTPYVVITDAVGVVRAKGTVNNLEQLEGLVDTARRRIAAPTAIERAS